MKIMISNRSNWRLFAFLFAFLNLACATVDVEERAETLERVLRLDPESLGGGQNHLQSSQHSAPPSATQSTPLGLSIKPAPNLKQPDKLAMPLPRGVVHSDLLHFINLHADVMSPYQPLADEWSIYSKVFSLGSTSSDEEVSGLRIRVRENLARSHWLFVWGVFQASNVMLNPQKQVHLLVDRQSDFIERMNVLVFLMSEMQAGNMNTDHRTFLRDFYKYINLKYFKRPMRDRPSKPIGQLRP